MRASQMKGRASRKPKAGARSMSRRSPMTRKTAQGYDEDGTYSITELDQQTRGEVVDREREEMYNSSGLLSNMLSYDWQSLNDFCRGVDIEYKNSGYSDYDWVRCVEDTGECHAETVSDLLQMDIYEAEHDGFVVGVGMAECYNRGLKEVIALQNKALSLADSPEMDRLEDMGFFDGGDDRADILDLICQISDQWYMEDASRFSDAVDEYTVMSIDGMNDGDVEVVMTLCDRINGQMNKILDEYNKTYQSVCQDAIDRGVQDIEADEEYLTSYEGIVENFENEDARFTSDGTRVAARMRSGMRAPKTRKRSGMRASQMRKRNRTGSSSKYEEWPPTDCDTVNEAIAIIEMNAPHRNHFALSDFVNSVMADECRNRYNVLDLAEHYGVLPENGELIRLFWQKFWDEVWSYLDEKDLLNNEFDWDSLDDDDAPIYASTTASYACGRGRRRSRRVR